MDFVTIVAKSFKGGIEIVPEFDTFNTEDIMVRGGKFYAIWDEEANIWKTSKKDVIRLIDNEIAKYTKSFKGESVFPRYLRNSSSGSLDKFTHYIEKQVEENFVPLNGKVIYSNTEIHKKDYASFKLDYVFEEGSIDAYDRLMSVLYSPEEREKLEWAIGCVACGETSKVEKFIVLTGDAGTGKSTVIKIIEKLFKGYTAPINAAALGDPKASFPLESLKNNPVVAIQPDAKLDKIKDNTLLNSLISHERVIVNTKYANLYSQRFNCMMFFGSNGDVEITDVMSGLQRRLIDVRPTGKLVSNKEYNKLLEEIDFELGAIAYHCAQVYKKNRHKYDHYRPIKSIRNTNAFYNFMEENIDTFKDGVSLKKAYEMYKLYCEDVGFQFTWNKMQVKRELMGYFKDFAVDTRINGDHVYNYYSNIRYEKFGLAEPEIEPDEVSWLKFDSTDPILDKLYSDQPAQYADHLVKWTEVKTTLKDIDITKYHYFLLPENVIKIDFDKRDQEGNKSLEENLKAASKFPKTYAEVSKSGQGIHLYYIWNGSRSVSELSSLIEDNVEIKTSTGKRSHRRIFTKCNDLPIATISSGLPFKEKKGGKELVDTDVMQNEKGLRTTIKRCIAKEIHPDTRSNIDWIHHILQKAYESDLVYDVSDLRQDVLIFALNSTNQSKYCVSKVREMQFKSKTVADPAPVDLSDKRIFYDVEVYPNLFLICWMFDEDDAEVHKLYNPTPNEVASLFGYEESRGSYSANDTPKPEIGGFNNRGYDDHICLHRIYGASNEKLYLISQAIINGDNDAKLREAYHLSDFDIYDFSSDKMSLKKWEIKLKIHHQEMGIPWDQPVPVERWEEVADYCANDVKATRAVFHHCHSDYNVRKLLADLSGLQVIDTNRMHITKILCGDNKYPDLIYTDLATGEEYLTKREYSNGRVKATRVPLGKPVLDYINEFPGYRFDPKGIPIEDYISKPTSKIPKSIFMGEEPSEGGYVYAVPGMYSNVICLDVAGMHPESVIRLNKLGPATAKYKEIRDARLAIKHKDFETAKKMLDGKLAKYLENEADADSLSGALKLILNSTYGIGFTSFENPLCDPTDEDNIVAKRGSLFAIALKNAVINEGYQVVHCKTDSIKIVDPDDYIINFVMEFGKKYGYTFEIEHRYEKFCLVNKAVYIAKNYIPNKKGQLWEATGAQFQQNYVFKTLFSKEPLTFDDKCETKNVTSAMYLDMNEELPEGEHNYIFVGRTGLFCPMKVGCGAGELMRLKDDKYYAVGGTKGYRWMESEMVEKLGLQDQIDETYYRKLVDAAIDKISQYGDFEWFVSGDPNSEEYEMKIA